MRFQIPFPDEAHYLERLQVSPDGRHVLISGTGPDGNGHFWVHSLDSMTTRLLPGTGFYPFWSYDSRFVAFFQPDKNAAGKATHYLKKVEVTGKDVACTRGDAQLTLSAIAAALTAHDQARALLADALSVAEASLQTHFRIVVRQ